MDAVIRIPAMEFNESLFKKIEELIEGKNAEIVIAIKEAPEPTTFNENEAGYWNKIDQSIEDIKAGKGTVFTMEEFERLIFSEPTV